MTIINWLLKSKLSRYKYHNYRYYRYYKSKKIKTYCPFFIWSNNVQFINCPSEYQHITFENYPIVPKYKSNKVCQRKYYLGWIIATEIGYDNPTSFIVPSYGFFVINYKIVIKLCSFDSCFILLTRNGNEIKGSTTNIYNPSIDNIYIISTNVLVELYPCDVIALLFKATNLKTTIGNSLNISNIETTSVSILITKY